MQRVPDTGLKPSFDKRPTASTNDTGQGQTPRFFLLDIRSSPSGEGILPPGIRSEMTQTGTPDGNRPGEEPRTSALAMLSIAGTWALYVVLVAGRIAVISFDRKTALIERHLLTAICGAIFTWAVFLMLKRWERWPIGPRLVLALTVTPVPALLLSMLNYDIMFVLAPAELWTAHYRQSVGLVMIAAQTLSENYFLMAAWAIAYTAVSSAARHHDVQRRVAVAEAELRTAQLASLRYQINPHLLFNALNTVSALVLEGDADGAERALMALSVFLRSALAQQTDEDVFLSDEIAHQQLYLEIERIRFGDRLCVEVLVPPALASARVPGLLLQPLVENSVRHGFSRISSPVRIVLRAEAIGDSLRLTVEDDAAADYADIGAREGAQPVSHDVATSSGSGLGLGLRNVTARLAKRFGDKARCSFSQRSTGGFIAEIVMPLRFSPA